MWHEFEKAYVNRDPCKIPINAYDSLVAAAPFEHSKTLFWSKTKNLVRDLTKNRDDVNLEKTLLGSVLDGLTWCGKMGSRETFTKGCPEWKECENNPPRSFWKRLSTAFADFAREDVTVILDGSIDTPFDPESTFATIEVKRIKYPKVKLQY
ncbi:ADP-ribosyl cyclase/cyclic ADP-ribose hydrolase 1-like isoform X2 [Notothenia coriiceps]|uniref:ADP-ribosyl cyclase/cyclic ADP-ribose hydrolase n=1 Tax=Notothenia coriiceps TaxID=8208 RepID=A0A6I9MVL6_9TELE|nr:PREDICTED: ADP-ribosyl cyclase/cyclic ADP-ribose hydrolase 1-like isoform X2 [Notothenia coriiceps]